MVIILVIIIIITIMIIITIVIIIKIIIIPVMGWHRTPVSKVPVNFLVQVYDFGSLC